MIWFGGTIRQDPAIMLDAGDRGLTLADGIFETIAVVNRAPFLLAEHLARLDEAAQVLGFALPRSAVEQAIADLAAASPEPDAAIRVTVTRGPGPRGLAPPAEPRPTVLASLASWSPSRAFQPVRLATSAIRRNETSPLSRIKSLAYLDNVLAFRQAQAAGADDALVLNTAGHVASTAMANLFLIQDGELVTPPVADGARPGVMRGLVLGLATSLGLRPVERSIPPAAFDGPTFATNSLRLLSPVSTLDGRPMRDSAVTGKIGARLRDLTRS